MTDGLEFDKGVNVDLPTAFAQVVGFILAPADADIILLCFAQLHGRHFLLHRQTSLLTRRRLAKKWKVEVLEVDLRRDRFL